MASTVEEAARTLYKVMKTKPSKSAMDKAIAAFFGDMEVGLADQDGHDCKMYREVAKKIAAASGGEIDVDENAIVSIGSDPGAYVAAWVWAPDCDRADAAELGDEGEEG